MKILRCVVVKVGLVSIRLDQLDQRMKTFLELLGLDPVCIDFR